MIAILFIVVCCLLAVAIGFFVFLKSRNHKKKSRPPNPQQAGSDAAVKNNAFIPNVVTYADFMKAIKDSTIYGTGTSKDVSIVPKELQAVQKSSASMFAKLKEFYRIQNNPKNHFEAEALRMADVAVPMCLALPDDAAFRQCSNKVLSSMPVLLEPNPTDADAPVLNTIKERMNACTDALKTNQGLSCLDGLFAYAKDLDNYGLPRNLKNYAKTIELLESIRKEADAYDASKNIEESAFKEALKSIDRFGLDPDLKFLSLYKRTIDDKNDVAGYAGTHTMALASYPAIFSWNANAKVTHDFGLYNFIHELGHMVVNRALVSLKASGYYKWTNTNMCSSEHPGHSDLWHKAVVFLSHLTRNHLMKTKVIKNDDDYAKLIGISGNNNFHYVTYHACHEPRWPSITRPSTWTVDVEYARNGPPPK